MSPIRALLVSVIAFAVLTEAKRGFLLTAPKILQAGAEEQLCMTFHDLDEDATTRVELLKKDGTELYSQVETFDKGRGRCFGFRVPSGVVKEALLAVRGEASDYVFAANKTVGIKAESAITFIQTDKPIYKPGQTVQFRILTLASDLKPLNVQLPLVAILDASGARVMQWNNVTSQKGLFSLKMPLAEEPVLGSWKIKAEVKGVMVEQIFKVEEYVLPKFEVTVSMPPYVLVDAEEITGEVCAKYTYGKPVEGKLQAEVCVEQTYHGRRKRPCFLVLEEINGCTKIAVNASELQLSSSHWSIWNAHIKVSARVTEQATGITLVGNSSNTSIERNPIRIDLSEGSPSHFKPGLPYHGKVKVTKPDGSPAPGEIITLRISNYRIKQNFIKNFTSDARGQFSFRLPPTDQNRVDYSIMASAPKYKYEYQPMYYRPFMPQAHLQVKQWYSPTRSFIQMEPIEQSVLCGKHLTVDVMFTTAANTSYKFYYQVMSRGNIVLSGHKHHHFGDRDAPVSNSDDRVAQGPDREETVPQHVASMPLQIFVDHKMSPLAHLLVYYIREDGETVADSIEFNIEKCFENKVSVAFSDAQLYPGEAVSVELRADAGSLCALGVIDKSVHLLGGNNRLSMGKVFEVLSGFELNEHSGPYVRDTYCDDKLREERPVDPPGPLPPAGPGPRPPPGPGPRPPPRPIPFRRSRSVFPSGYGYSRYYDSSRAFKVTGISVMSDLTIDSRPCQREDPFPEYMLYDIEDDGIPGPGGRVAMTSVVDTPVLTKNEVQPKEKKAVDIRTYFPETWLWQIREIGPNGRLILREQMPHSLTEWVGSSFCTNEKSGLGVSDVATVRGFQPFFASFTLPYSVVRGERVPIIVTVFNYLSECLVVELTLKKSSSYRVLQNARKAKICVCGGKAQSHTFTIIANQLGDVNITVKAESVSSDDVCGNAVVSSQTGARDAVTRKLIVEPEGREEEYTVASFICPEDGSSHMETMDLPLPSVIVQDSARAYITTIGDVMGTSLSGLDKLLAIPTGCGEQNMIKFAPNIFVLQYLESTNQAAPSITNKALGYMRIGYQRELRYRHKDGSYSAFGESDPSGSMWLTAFVVKSFAQASKFIHVDQEDLEKSLTWFKSKQLENGCFPQVGKVLHKAMKGGLSQGGSSPATLTAFVLAAMLEAGIDKQDDAVTNALLCLRAQETELDVYTTALLAYTYTLYDPATPERAVLMEKLSALAKSGDGMMHWEATVTTEAPKTKDGWLIRPYYQAKSADVEMTAYALLAYVLGEEESVVSTGLPIVRWLSKQRNAYGGFSSTQDTVVALNALAEYASLVYGDGVNMRVQVNGQDFSKTFRVSDTNSLVLQSEKISVPNRLAVTATGTGCVLFQANVKYNVYNMTDDLEPAFSLQVVPSNTPAGTGADGCKKRSISVCTRYTGPGNESNMAIVAVKMVSGYIPDKESIKQLKQQTKLGLKRYEVDKNWVNLYFDKLTPEFKCVKFIVEQEIEIANVKPAYVHVYDYYDKDLSARAKYKLRPICGTKNELPVLTREEYDNRTRGESAFLGQHRMPFNEHLPSVKPVIEVNIDSICPVCLSDAGDFLPRFCLSRHAYKVEVRNKTRFPLKVLADLRAEGRKEPINRYTNYTIPAACLCDTLRTRNSKVIVLTKETELTTVGKRHGTFHFSSDHTIFPMKRVREMEQQMRRTVRKKRCGTK